MCAAGGGPDASWPRRAFLTTTPRQPSAAIDFQATSALWAAAGRGNARWAAGCPARITQLCSITYTPKAGGPMRPVGPLGGAGVPAGSDGCHGPRGQGRWGRARPRYLVYDGRHRIGGGLRGGQSTGCSIRRWAISGCRTMEAARCGICPFTTTAGAGSARPSRRAGAACSRLPDAPRRNPGGPYLPRACPT